MRVVLLTAVGGLAITLVAAPLAAGAPLSAPVVRALAAGCVALPLLGAGALALRAARRSARAAPVREKTG